MMVDSNPPHLLVLVTNDHVEKTSIVPLFAQLYHLSLLDTMVGCVALTLLFFSGATVFAMPAIWYDKEMSVFYVKLLVVIARPRAGYVTRSTIIQCV
jgi:hypothetical protein